MHHPYPWPIGTCHFTDLPTSIKTSLAAYIDASGYVEDNIMVHQTATEGAYIEYCGYKIRVIIDTITPTSFKVRIA